MADGKEKQGGIKPLAEEELPPEFRKFDKPFGFEQHNFIMFKLVIGHIVAIYFLYLVLFGYVPRTTLIPGALFGYWTGLGITVGAHRYWTHRTFKATKPMQVLLMLMQTASLQYPIFKWCRDHRLHHKYTDTDADPHNASRGFWFSHIIWLIKPKHPELIEKMKIIDISDLARDPIVRFQSKYYWELLLIVFLLVPMTIFKLMFPELTLFQLFGLNCLRFVGSLHFTFLVNSVAHIWGDKPYDKYITPTENKFVSLLAVGEGWHNYHHTFPWDYKSAEFGYRYNLSTAFINFFAWIGWIYDMKTVSHKLLVDRINRTGDGSHPLHKKDGRNMQENLGDTTPRTCWGWGDEELRKEDMEVTEIIFASKNRRG